MIRLEQVWTQERIQNYEETGFQRVTCPICGNETFDNWAICPHCFWEYDYIAGYSAANRSYPWWYRLKYKTKRLFRKRETEFNSIEYLGSLLGRTKEGWLTLTYYEGDQALTIEYPVDWSFDDACMVGERLSNLLNQLQDIVSVQELGRPLPLQLQEVWEIYLAPFDGIDADQVARMQIKERFEGLTTEESAWLADAQSRYEEQCLKRLPFHKTAPTGMIHEAGQFYNALISGDTRERLVETMSRLAEQMVLYYFQSADSGVKQKCCTGDGSVC